jgi:hypothetical protein
MPRDSELDKAAAGVAEIAAAAVAELAAAVGNETAPPPPAELPAVRQPWTGPATMHATGEAHGSAKLTRADVGEIRRLRAAGSSTGELAKRFGVTRGTICYACKGKTWADPSPPLPVTDG